MCGQEQLLPEAFLPYVLPSLILLPQADRHQGVVSVGGLVRFAGEAEGVRGYDWEYVHRASSGGSFNRIVGRGDERAGLAFVRGRGSLL